MPTTPEETEKKETEEGEKSRSHNAIQASSTHKSQVPKFAETVSPRKLFLPAAIALVLSENARTGPYAKIPACDHPYFTELPQVGRDRRVLKDTSISLITSGY